MVEKILADIPGPDPRPKTPSFKLPTGSVDTHYHIFDAPSQLAENRSYTPPVASESAFASLQYTLGFQRSVVVQPSIYGTDNRTTLQHASNSSDRRAIIVLHHVPTAADLEELHDQSCRGVRINALFKGATDIGMIPKLAEAIAPFDWHLEFLINVSEGHKLLDEVSNLPVPIVIDHMGHVPALNGVEDLGFQSLLRHVSEGTAYVKLSAPYRLGANVIDCAPFVHALVEANPDRLLWGTDWPHPAFDGPMPNDGDLVDLIPEWLPTPELQQKVLVDNPQKLYGFGKL